MPRRVQEAMKTGAGEIRVAEAKGRGGQRGSRKKTRRVENKKGEKNSRSKESSRGVGDLE